MQPSFHIPDSAPIPNPADSPCIHVAMVDLLSENQSLKEENKVLRELLDLFEDYCEFRMGVRPFPGIQVKDIPNLKDINRARKLLGYEEIGSRNLAAPAAARVSKINLPT